uniref:Uncharacterized protein n=1 Tax=Rhizophora mucronata TaxID=61149 RepID=A0A2P2JCF5_RHIMU
MDLATENKIATMLLKEASELRKRAEKEGVHVYLEQPKVRGRPNGRFLTATVLGVQQANRAVEVNEMWQIRQKELEMEDRVKRKSRHERHNSMNCSDVTKSSRSASKRYALTDNNTSTSYSAGKRVSDNNSGEDEGLREEEIEEFLHSRLVLSLSLLSPPPLRVVDFVSGNGAYALTKFVVV